MSPLGWVLVLMAAGIAVAANLLLRAGVDRAGGFAVNLGHVHLGLLALARQPLFDLGLVLYVLTTLIWFRVLSTEPLSVAYPVMTSATFLFVTIGAVVLFREPLNAGKILGLLVILAGILMVSRS